MFSSDVSRLYAPSPTSKRSYQRLRQLNIVTYVLLAMIAALGIWSIMTVMGAFSDSIPDLADVGSIKDHISARLVTFLTIATVVIFAFKEWRYGDRGVGMLYFLAVLLAFWLFPVVAAELEPDPVQLEMEFTLNRCESGAIDGSTELDSSLCKIVDPETVTVLMSDANPTREDAVIREPDTLMSNLSRWYVDGRGDFYVYFMLQQESMESCESANITTNDSAVNETGYTCMEHDGSAWSVHQFETGELQTGRLVVYQEQP